MKNSPRVIFSVRQFRGEDDQMEGLMTPPFMRNEISALHIHDEMSMQSRRHIDVLHVYRNSAATATDTRPACIYLLYIYKAVSWKFTWIFNRTHVRISISRRESRECGGKKEKPIDRSLTRVDTDR